MSSDPDTFVVHITDNLGSLSINGLLWESPKGENALFDFRWQATIGVLSLRDVHVVRTADGHAVAPLLNVPARNAIGVLHLDGIFFENGQGTKSPPVPELLRITAGGSIRQVDVGSVDTSNVERLAEPGDLNGLGEIYGPGLAASGFQVPEAKVPNGVPFVSADSKNAGHLCFKRSGKLSCL